MADFDYSEEVDFDIENVHREPSVESRIIETEAMQDPNMRISDPLTVVTKSPSRVIGASPDEAGRALQLHHNNSIHRTIIRISASP